MSSNNIEKAQRLYDAIGAGDWATVNTILSPDVVVTEASGLPYGGTYRGHDGFLNLMEKLAETWENLRPANLKFAAVDDSVYVDFLLLGKCHATGREVEMPLIEKWNFKDGLVVSGCVFYYDTHEIRSICGIA